MTNLADPADRAMANYIRASECWALASGGRFWESGGLACAATSLPRRAFNQIIVTSVDVTDAALGEAIAWYRERSLRFRVRVRDILEEAMQPRFEAFGLESRGGLPALVLEAELPGGFSNALDIQPARDRQQFVDMVTVVAHAFEWEANQLSEVFKPELVNQPGWHGWVGYEGEMPVAASQTVVHGGVAGIHYVAALSSHRRKGYGEAITRVAVEKGRSLGCDLVCLNASQDGYPIYKRLGFRDTGKHMGYVTPDEED